VPSAANLILPYWAYGKAENGNGNRNRKGNGKLKWKLLHSSGLDSLKLSLLVQDRS